MLVLSKEVIVKGFGVGGIRVCEMVKLVVKVNLMIRIGFLVLIVSVLVIGCNMI